MDNLLASTIDEKNIEVAKILFTPRPRRVLLDWCEHLESRFRSCFL
jgi:hypothetical protein